MSELLFEYKVRYRYKTGYKEFSFYATTDIEEFLNRNSIDYVRNATDTVEHRLFKEIERLNNIIENLTTMTVNGDRTQIKNTAQYKIDRAIEYHDNCVNNLLDLDKIDENERLAYKVAYEIHDNYLNILKGSDKE